MVNNVYMICNKGAKTSKHSTRISGKMIKINTVEAQLVLILKELVYSVVIASNWIGVAVVDFFENS